MIDSLALTLTLACLLGALGVTMLTVAGGFRAERVGPALLVLEVALLLQGVFAVAGLVRGHRPPELVTFVAYLAFSLVVVPVAATQVRGTAGRWAGAVVAVALVVQAVVVVRLQTTWRTV